MPWIYFARDEPPAPSLKLASLKGSWLEPSDFRGGSGLVLFFTHGLACPACLSLVQELAGAEEAVRLQEAQALVILPEEPAQSLPDLGGLQFLIDRQGLLRRAYASIFEFDVSQKAMLFILNQFGAPFRAWVGDEPDAEVLPQMLKYLESAALLCPE
jgi:peroxiredoxin